MNRLKLKEKLDEILTNPNFYSLDGKVIPDRLILIPSGTDWIVFYLDERGGRHEEHRFTSESDACEYIYEHFVWLKNRYGV